MIRIKAPCECLATEKTNFIELVKKEDQVEQNGLKERVELSEMLSVLQRDKRDSGCRCHKTTLSFLSR